jgi:hypothetical protein
VSFTCRSVMNATIRISPCIEDTARSSDPIRARCVANHHHVV